MKAPRENQILAAAFEEFAANGYAAARLDKVAERANVAKGTIYIYFTSKSRLFQAVVRSLIRPIPDQFELLVKNSSAYQLLSDLILRQYDEVVTNRKARAILGLLIAESGKFPQLWEVYQREVVEPGIRAIRMVLEKGFASGEFKETGVLAFPEIVAAPAVLAIVRILIHGNHADLDLDAFRAAHLELILSALRNEAPREAAFPSAAGRQGERL